MELQYRKVARRLNIRKRFMALTANERQRANFWRKFALVCLVRFRRFGEQRMQTASRVALFRYFQLLLEPADTALERPLRMPINIAAFSESTCWNNFETRREDLPRLLAGLRFPATCRLENRSSMSGEEVLLRGLHELVRGHDQFSMAESVFGRDQSQQSRAFKFFITHIFDNFLYLVNGHLQWWHDNGFVADSNAAIKAKLEELGMEFTDEWPCDVAAILRAPAVELLHLLDGLRVLSTQRAHALHLDAVPLRLFRDVGLCVVPSFVDEAFASEVQLPN